MDKKIVEFKNLSISFKIDEGIVRAVNDVSFEVRKGEVLGIVGESGCGKSVTSMSLMRLLPVPPTIYESGSINLNGVDILSLSEEEMREKRGSEVAIIFQEPMTSLNPVMKIGHQISEVMLIHQKISKSEAKKRAIELINLVGIPRAESIFNSYPHELSGGMRQRIMIAIALACNPKVLIADEPTTALDVTIQAQILDLIKNMKSKFDMSIMMITHDLGVIAEMADYVIVMYAGKIVEKAKVLDIFKNPKHPYTIGLMKSKPTFEGNNEKLYSIPGQVPNPMNLPNYCYFYERCDRRKDICKKGIPDLISVGNSHYVSCYLLDKEGE
ncbi:ABC transporter ATP-binding protein [Candidatus Arthromitus sp. SFB-turkey]|uniref:ABC transporter ATP-binding protein n=1 Tax=Candidatus Arthromitus sp. SFB-turkey TaxID=1840217 RepID=UPI0007F4935A|nr:ABC transporter ATP-binding protein [Candidatus Arthromitus sp. SFB-turkey]OAT88016.1 dipeptide/oligopeptide/nickel ABC transporter ATP-binding protein [Candidatus Arthromitus sp. SFB-turkey]